MVAIFTGGWAGLERGSANILGSAGLIGSSSLGRGGEQVFVNGNNGNLVVTQQDEFLIGRGPDAVVSRTYNSVGDQFGQYWRDSNDRTIHSLTGTLNTAGSTVQRVSADGTACLYQWNASKSAYVTTDGGGAYDTLTCLNNVWTWTDGDTQVKETYLTANGIWRISAQTDPDGNSLSFSYYASGALYQVTTQDGSYVQYNWDSSYTRINELVTGYTDDFTDPLNPVAKTLTRTRYAYEFYDSNSDGTNDRYRLQTVTVDLSPGDSSVADGKTYVTTYAYVGNSNLIDTIAQSDGSLIDIGWTDGRVTSIAQTVASGVTRTTFIDYGTPNVIRIIDPLNQEIRLEKDPNTGDLVKITMPAATAGAAQQVVEFDYTASGDIEWVKDALGNVTTYGDYDSNGNAWTITDRLGNVTTRTFGAKNELLTETITGSDTASSAAAHTTRFVYDSENHLRARVSAEGEVTSFAYTTQGRMASSTRFKASLYDVSSLSPTASISETDLNNWFWGAGGPTADQSNFQTTEYHYDARGNVSDVVNLTYNVGGYYNSSEGYTRTVYTYDQAGKLLSRKADFRMPETFVYDGLGRLVSAIDVHGGTTSYVFDDANSKTVVTLASGLVQTSTYNTAGELISFAEAGALSSPAAVTGTATFGYDKLGQLRWNIDATGRKIYHLYDNVGRKVADISKDLDSGLGEFVEYKYDANNRLAATVRYTNTVGSAGLTDLDDLTVAADIGTYRPAGLSTDLWNWRVYDNEGRLVQTIDGAGLTTVHSYDGAGRLVKSTSYANNVATATVQGFKTTPPTTITYPWPIDDPNNRVSRNFYDKDGRLVGTLDGQGFVTKIVYDKAGQRVEEIAYANAASNTTGTFNAVVASVAVDNARDRHTHFAYNGQGQLRFVVDSNHQVTETRYADGDGQAQTTIRYATALSSVTTDFTINNLKSLVAASGFASADDRWNWVVYDAAGRVAQTIDGVGLTTINSYNAIGQLTKSVSYANNVSTATVQTFKTTPPTSVIYPWPVEDPNNRTTRYFYDGAGVLRYTVDPEGYVTRRTEDAEGRLELTERFANAASVTDSTTISALHGWVTASGGTSANSSTTYDVDGRVATVTDGELTVTKSVYNTNGTLQSVTVAYGTPDASTTSFTYDAAGRVISETRGGIATTQYGYDAFGNVLTLTDANNHVTTRTYDRLGRMLTSTNALNGVTTYEYDSFGAVVKTINPRGSSSYNYYDRLGRLTATRDAEDYVTETSYTVFGEVYRVIRWANKANNAASTAVYPTHTIDAKDAITTFDYDKLGRLTRTTDAEGYYEQYTLNAFGDRVVVVNKLGGTITNTFDRRGLLVSETLPMASVSTAGATVATTVINTFSYDARGNRTQMVEASGLAEQRTTNYVYDQADRLTSKTGDAVTTVAYVDFTSTTAVTVTTTNNVVPTESYAYDRRGNLILLTDANGARTFAYYDALNRKTGEVGPLGTLKAWTYDAAGNRLTERVYGDFVNLPAQPGGTAPVPIDFANYRETVYAYDNINRLTSTSVAGVLIGTWDAANGGVSRSTVTISSSLTYDANGNVITGTDANGNSVYSWYDKLGRKTAQLDQELYLTKWTYDSEGNVVSETRHATKYSGTIDLESEPSGASSGDDRITTFTYDRNGRRLSETRAAVEFVTIANALTGALSTPAAGNSVVTYTYNGLGQVTSKQEATGDTVAYTYDGTGRLTSERRTAYTDHTGAGVTPQVIYSYNGLNNLTRTQQGERTAIEASSSAGRITTYAYAAGGRLAAMTDPAGGQHSYNYDAAGNQVRDSYTRAKSDGTTVSEAILYRRDLLGRVVTQTIAANNGGSWTRGDSQNTQYNAYGDVEQRGVNGLWQEQFTYDSRGLVEKTNSGDGVWRFFVYDKQGNQVLAVEDENYTLQDLGTKTLNDVLGYLGTYAGAGFVDGLTATVSIYDKRNQVVQTIQRQRELSQTGAKVHIITSQTYNAFGEVKSQLSGVGNQQATQPLKDAFTTYFTYNTMGRLIQKVMPQITIAGGAQATPTESYYYDLSGRLIGTADANSFVTDYATTASNATTRMLLAGTGYNGSEALVTAEYHRDGGIAKNLYDVFGDVRIARNELNFDETRTYDGMGRVLTVTHRGHLVNGSLYQLVDNYAYDLLGQRIHHWNSFYGTANTERTDYDLQGRVTTTIDFAGDKTTYDYFWEGTIATALGTSGGWRKVTTRWADTANAKTRTERHDVHGLQVEDTDYGNHVTTYAYDKAGRLTNKSAGGTSHVYTYYNTGLTKQVVDTAGTNLNTLTSTYDYDADGRRIREKVAGTVYKSTSTWNSYTSSTETLQDAGVTYNALGWMTRYNSVATAGTVTIDQTYDKNGNVITTNTTYPNLVAGGSAPLNRSYSYDAMNRMVSVGGTGLVGIGSQPSGTTITYDVAGNRKTEYWYYFSVNFNGSNSQKTEYLQTFGYDNENNLATVTMLQTSNGTPGTAYISSSTKRDELGRVQEYRENDYLGNALLSRTNIQYNSRGQVTDDDVSQKKTDGATYLTKTDNVYDARGNLISTASDNYKNNLDSGAPDTLMTYGAYTYFQDAVISTQSFDNDTGASGSLWTTTYTYDGLGRQQRAAISDGRPRTVHFGLTPEGQILSRVENNASTSNPRDYHQFLNGVQVGEFSNNTANDPTNLDYDLSIHLHKTIAGTGNFRNGATTGTAGGEFGQSSFDRVNPVTAQTSSTATSSYTVQDGDTLHSIATQTWGDSSLWYLIADANGLSSSTMLVSGQTLAIPARGPTSANNAHSFKPYDVSHAVGDLSPTRVKPPKGNKCGMFGQILLIAIAVAVTLIIKVPVTNFFTGLFTGTAAAGSAVAATAAAAGGIVGAATTAAVASVVSQGVGVATGIQDKFNWKGVAFSALTAGVAHGLGQGGVFGQGGLFGGVDEAGKLIAKGAIATVGSAAIRAGLTGLASNALTQGIGVVTGLQKKFDWAGVAAAGASAAANGAFGSANFLKNVQGFDRGIFASMASNVADAATRSLVGGTDFGDNMLGALQHIIGETIGGMVQDAFAAAEPVPGDVDETVQPAVGEDGEQVGESNGWAWDSPYGDAPGGVGGPAVPLTAYQEAVQAGLALAPGYSANVNGYDYVTPGQMVAGLKARDSKGNLITVSLADAEKYAPYLNDAMYERGLTTTDGQSAFLAQTFIETGGFKSTHDESFAYRRANAESKFSFMRDPKNKAAFDTLFGKDNFLGTRLEQETFANIVYNDANRGPKVKLGNIVAGDGFLFRGRGMIQLTGRYQYGKIGGRLGVDFESNPALVNDIRYSSRAGAAYFSAGLVSAANLGQIAKVNSGVATDSASWGRRTVAFQNLRSVLRIARTPPPPTTPRRP